MSALAARAFVYWQSARALNLPGIDPEIRAVAASNMRAIARLDGPLARRATRCVASFDGINLYGGPDDAA